MRRILASVLTAALIGAPIAVALGMSTIVTLIPALANRAALTAFLDLARMPARLSLRIS